MLKTDSKYKIVILEKKCKTVKNHANGLKEQK